MTPASIDSARRALNFVSPEERDTWVRMGMALKAEFGDDAFDMWDQWSLSSAAYDQGAVKSSWKSFKAGGKVGIGSLFKEAQNNGFIFDNAEIEVDPAKLAAERAAREARNAKSELDRITRAKAAANRAQVQWRMAATDGTSPYLERKQVLAESCKFLADGAIIVPMFHVENGMVGKQQINADGSKKYSHGMDRHSAMARLGVAPFDGDTVYLCEGYATGGSIRAALNYQATVFVCFDTSGLMPVAQAVRKMLPTSHIMFCADDDYLTGGAGVNKAQAAADWIRNAGVFLPSFTAARRLTKADESFPMLTDCNDLHVAEGLHALADQLSAAIDLINSVVTPDESPAPSEDEVAAAFASDGKPAAVALVEGRGEAKKKSKKVFNEGHWDAVAYLLEHFVLIYGDDTCWDGVNRILLKVNHLRLAYGSDAVKFWLNNPDRKMVNKDDVVFDPTLKADPETKVNLFDGIKLAPKAGDCSMIIKLLDHLCGDDADVVQWVTSWLAYPLQHPGAKMRTSIIMHGDEGSGKNLFFEDCVAKIYGKFGGVIGNAQIEAAFNEWASGKLFMVADEVVTRNELRQLKGKIKHMVTGGTIRINPKGLSERDEANHMNFVFLSNELQPLALDKTDRRYQVIWTPAKREESFYSDVAAQMENGGLAAFYDFLLKFPIGDFTEHTKPLMTEAKQNLISLGLSATERFYREWSGGFLPLPFVCCSAMQLYMAFCRWSHLNGERFPATQTMFGRTINRVAFGEMTTGPVKYAIAAEVKQRTVYMVGEQPLDKDRAVWVENGSELFESYLRKYRHVFEPIEEGGNHA